MTNSTIKSTISPDQPLAHDPLERSAISKILSTNRFAQWLEITIVFSPALLVIGTFRMISTENPMLFMAAIWVANAIMLALVWLGIRACPDFCVS
jgi:hypothetical protein